MRDEKGTEGMLGTTCRKLFPRTQGKCGGHCRRTLTHSSTLKNAKYDQTNTQLQIHIHNWYEITEMF